MTFAKHLLVAALAASAVAAQANSDINSGTAGTALTATANLDFRVVVPRVLFLRVGSGTDFADNAAAIDRVDFNLTATDVITALGGGSTTVAGAGGVGTHPVALRVLGNGGNVSLSANGTAGGLSNGTAAENIPWSRISATGATPHPAIGNGVAGAAQTLTATHKVVNVNSTWTFSYANSAAQAEGTYNGSVVYTASLP